MPVPFKVVPLAMCAALLSSGCAMLSLQSGPGTVSNGSAAGASAAISALQADSAVAAQTAGAADLDVLFRQGRRELIAGRPRVAIEHFAALLDREPRHVEALNALGVAVAEMGRLPEAISLLRRAASLAPQAVHVRNNLGHALYRAGDLAQARVELHTALELQPHNLSALHNLALLDQARAPARHGTVPPAPTAAAPHAPSGGRIVGTAPSVLTPSALQAALTLQAASALRTAPAVQAVQAAPAAPTTRMAPTTQTAQVVSAAGAELRRQADASPAAQPGAGSIGLAEHAAVQILGLDDSGLASTAALRAGARAAPNGMAHAAERRAARGARHAVPPGRRLVVQSDSPTAYAADQPAQDVLGLEAGRFARARAERPARADVDRIRM